MALDEVDSGGSAASGARGSVPKGAATPPGPPGEGPAGGRYAAVATAGTALSRLTGFMRLAAMAYALGVAEGGLADTYNIANLTPNIVYELVIGGILSSVLLRVYIEVRDSEGQPEAFRFISRLTTLVMLVLGAISVLGILLAPAIFRLYTTLADASAVRDAAGTFLLRLFIPQLLFYGLSTISTAVLDAHRRFGVPKFAPVAQNLVVTAMLLLFAATVPEAARNLANLRTADLLLLGAGTTLGVALLGLTPWFWMRRLGYRFEVGGLRDPRFRRLARLSAWMFGYVATNQIGLTVATVLAAKVTGGVTAYQYAFVFFQLPHGLLAVSIATVTYTGLTESAVAGDTPAFARKLGRAMRVIAFFVLPAIAGYLAIGRGIVKLLLQHGITTELSTNFIADVLRAWSPGILFFSTWYIILRGFYALGDTKTPMLINLGAIAFNVVAGVGLFFAFDNPVRKIMGLALAHAGSYAVASAIGIAWMSRRVGGSLLAGYAPALGKMIVASTVTGGVAAGVFAMVQSAFAGSSTGAQLAAVLGATLAGLLIYALSAKLLRLEESQWITKIVARR